MEVVSFVIRVAMSVVVSPDALSGEFMKVVIAVAKLLVPAVDAIVPIIPPPIDMEIELLPILPFMTPSDASFIMAVTKAEETGMLRVFADCDMAATVRP